MRYAIILLVPLGLLAACGSGGGPIEAPAPSGTLRSSSQLIKSLVRIIAIAWLFLALWIALDNPFPREVHLAAGSMDPFNEFDPAFLIVLASLGIISSFVQATFRLLTAAAGFLVILGYASANYLDLHLDSEWSRAEVVASAAGVLLISAGIGPLTIVAGAGIGQLYRDALALARKADR